MWCLCPLFFLSGPPAYSQPPQNNPGWGGGGSFERHSNSNKQKLGNSGLASTSCLPVSLSHSILALLLTDQLLRLHFLDHPPSHKTSFGSQTFRRVSYSEYGKFGTKVFKALQTLFLFIFVCEHVCVWCTCDCACVC